MKTYTVRDPLWMLTLRNGCVTISRLRPSSLGGRAGGLSERQVPSHKLLRVELVPARRFRKGHLTLHLPPSEGGDLTETIHFDRAQQDAVVHLATALRAEIAT